MGLPDLLRFSAAFARDRYGLRFGDRGELVRFQERRLRRFLAECLPRVRYYRGLAGRPLRELLDASREADVLVVGARGIGAVERLLLGSVAEGAVTHAPVAVLVVH